VNLSDQLTEAAPAGQGVDPKKTLPAVQKALEQITGLTWKYKGPLGTPPSFAKFWSPGATHRETRQSRVSWKGTGKFATLSVESKKHIISLSGDSLRQLADPAYLAKSLKQSHFEA